jgi:hypothetical protein
MKAIPLKDLQSHLLNIDSFICAASFETRCLSVAGSLTIQNITSRILCYNGNELGILGENFKILCDLMGDPIKVEFDSNDPIKIGDSLFKLFDKKASREFGNVLVDITTFTHEGLLILFKYFQIYRDKFDELFFVYVGAEKYSINETELGEKWLTKGIRNIRSVLGYPGVLRPSRKNHLIVLFGFESDRTKKLIDQFEFDTISLGFGSALDSINDSHYQLNVSRHKELLNSYIAADCFEFSVTNPMETKNNILAQISKYGDHNVVIAPMNTKLSTIGAALVASEHPEIQLCYAQASQYNTSGYSEPLNTCVLISLDL